MRACTAQPCAGAARKGSGLCKHHYDEQWRLKRSEWRRNRHLSDVLESGPADPPHWACPDCGAPCYCVDPLVRSLPHRPCNVPEVVAA